MLHMRVASLPLTSGEKPSLRKVNSGSGIHITVESASGPAVVTITACPTESTPLKTAITSPVPNCWLYKVMQLCPQAEVAA
jgi:hypothetical protein